MSTRNLDKYEGRYASRTRVMRSSAMRDLMSLTARPEIISLAGGLPATDTFPRDVFERINAAISAENRALALQYGPTEGFDFLKEDIASVMAAEGTPADPQWILVTTGGQQAIDLVTKTFIDPGDVVLAEGPSYAGALTTFSTLPDRRAPRSHGRRRPDHRRPRGTDGPRRGRGQAQQVPLCRAQLQQPGRHLPVAGPALAS